MFQGVLGSVAERSVAGDDTEPSEAPAHAVHVDGTVICPTRGATDSQLGAPVP
jgi:hypothetical protein